MGVTEPQMWPKCGHGLIPFPGGVWRVTADEASELVAVDLIRQVGKTPVTPDMIRSTLAALSAHPLDSKDCESADLCEQRTVARGSVGDWTTPAPGHTRT